MVVMMRRKRTFHPCPCGSGRNSSWRHDARNVPLARTCVVCDSRVMAKYRPEVLTDPNYSADEPIEGD
jgi:hypothetical protein